MNEHSSNWLENFIFSAMPWIGIAGVRPWLQVVVQTLLALLAVFVFHGIGTRVLERLSAPFPFTRRLVRYTNQTGGVIVFLLLWQIVLRNAADSLAGIFLLRHLNALALYMAFTWFGVRCVGAVADTIVELNPVDAPDNLQARRIQTQTKVLARAVIVLVVMVGSGLALMTLPLLRQIGTSLLASAGVAGLVIGFAARPVLSNLLAGIQLALTQPIRLEDVVIVEKEWGQIEEITGTYVVVRIWDQRRLVVPLQWFIEHPFQNWTRTSSEILGTVLIWADYRLPLDPVRKEAERLCEASPAWDRRLCVTQVVEAGERAMQLRVLVSAGDAGKSWDLRCKIREGLIDFIQKNYPEYLPRVRADVSGENIITDRVDSD
ncbi:MAG: mechanosensitive ion channel protein MscS [Burkholderiales bacterium RIFCSPLOWO2_02_FULL_57_36]|nr:MAG: mechanosensitive ion channel protein MscS [Burkholderiales bacterium RIFCSPLOWO2_02_FULL_57_36]